MSKGRIPRERKIKKVPISTVQGNKPVTENISKFDVVIFKINQISRICQNGNFVPNEMGCLLAIDLLRQVMLMQDDYHVAAMQIPSKKFFKICSKNYRTCDISQDMLSLRNEVWKHKNNKKKLFVAVRNLIEKVLSHKDSYTSTVRSELRSLFNEG